MGKRSAPALLNKDLANNLPSTTIQEDLASSVPEIDMFDTLSTNPEDTLALAAEYYGGESSPELITDIPDSEGTPVASGFQMPESAEVDPYNIDLNNPTQANVEWAEMQSKSSEMETDEDLQFAVNTILSSDNGKKYAGSLETKPSMFSRGLTSSVNREQGRNPIRYNPLIPTLTPLSDGGFAARADNFANQVSGLETFPSGVFNTKPTVEGQVSPNANLGNLGKLFKRVGAVSSNQDGIDVLDKQFLALASMVTEDVFADVTLAETRTQEQKEKAALDPFGSQTSIEGADFSGPPKPLSITKAQQNAVLGNRVIEEWNLVSGKPNNIDKTEATLLGDALKELYFEVNQGTEGAKLLTRKLQDPTNEKSQVIFTVTQLGQSLFQDSEQIRKMYFPKEHVDPLLEPRQKIKTRVAGKLKGVDENGQEIVVTSEILEEAISNLESVGHLVDEQRLKILYSTLIPALLHNPNSTDLFANMSAEIHGVGETKLKSFMAKQMFENSRANGNKDYNSAANMIILKRHIAQSALGIAKAGHATQHLTYFLSAFNGRLTPEQTHFNLTNSKQVRFVTRNPAQTEIKWGSNIEDGLRQMYAMALIKGADSVMPRLREAMFKAEQETLAADGKILLDALTMTKEETDQISEAIKKGISLNSPEFPKISGGLKLDAENPSHKRIMEAIQSKGDDGPAYIDGLIDVYKYTEAKKNNTQFYSSFNVYIDGKTNGIAINAMQLGSEPLARMTGITREGADDVAKFAVQDDVDIRDYLADQLTQALEGESEGMLPDRVLYDEFKGMQVELTYVIKELFNYRQLNKDVTMTFGYGKQLESFKQDLEQALFMLAADPALSKFNDEGQSVFESLKILDAGSAGYSNVLGSRNVARGKIQERIVDIVFDTYMEKVREVMTPEAIQARSLMYGAAMFHVLADEVYEIKSAMGIPIRLGGRESLGFQEKNRTKYTVFTTDPDTGERQQRTVHANEYDTRSTSSAVKFTGYDKDGNRLGRTGGKTFGGIIPGPIQSMDAATVALVSSGKAWVKLTEAAGSNTPYLHTIYDAFKLDPSNFQVGVKTINDTWLEANMGWNYLKQTRAALVSARNKFNNKMDKLTQGSQVSISGDSGYRMFGEILNVMEVSDRVTGKPYKIRPELTRHLSAMHGGDKKSEKHIKEVKVKINKFNEILREAGIGFQSHSSLTPQQIKIVYNAFYTASEYGGNNKYSLNTFIKIIDKKRYNLFNKIKKSLASVLQFYGH